MPGTLYLCATPIGNLEDITLRVLRTLKEADLIAAEDTRTSGHLLAHFGIETPTISYHKFNEKERGPELVGRLLAGANIALITDAGTPAISDPGFNLARDAIARGFAPPPAPGERRRSGPPIRRLCRATIHPMPDIRDVIEAYRAARGRGRVEEKIRCGSLLLDAEAGVDSSLIRSEAGEIVGRKPGLRGWIGDRAPWLLKHYVSLMQYRRLAQAFREAHGLRDPHPATLLLDDDAPRIFPQPLRGRLEAARREAKALLASEVGRTVKDFRQALARREWRRTG